MEYDVFISYSRKDISEVLAIKQAIERKVKGIRIWFDINGIESGDEFEDKIIKAINNSKYVLFALSPNSIGSQWTKDEVMYAKNTSKKVVPILLRGAKLEGWFLFKFGRIDCIDSTNRLQMEKLTKNLSLWCELDIAVDKGKPNNNVSVEVDERDVANGQTKNKKAGSPQRILDNAIVIETTEKPSVKKQTTGRSHISRLCGLFKNHPFATLCGGLFILFCIMIWYIFIMAIMEDEGGEYTDGPRSEVLADSAVIDVITETDRVHQKAIDKIDSIKAKTIATFDKISNDHQSTFNGTDNPANNNGNVEIESPSFYGGTDELKKWMYNNLRYPADALENGITGRVIVSFVVEKDGSITDIQIVKGVNPSLDKEALRVVANMPKWITR